MTNIILNKEKNGIEVRFDVKPAQEIIDSLKEHGFRWSGKQKMWYAKQDSERLALVDSLSDVTLTQKNNESKDYDLWAMTRTDGIEDNYALYHITDCKEIAARIREHIKSRFPMCKFSVRKTNYDSLDVAIVSSPFAKDSDELRAIAHYVYCYAQSYNYDNSDSMTDYFDVNFYGVYEHEIVNYRYEQREMTESEHAMCEAFKASEEAYRKVEEERIAKEEQEAEERYAKEAAEAAERERIYQANHQIIEDSVKVEDNVEYFVRNCEGSNLKWSSLKSYYDALESDDDLRLSLETCKITRKVSMTSEVFDLFSGQLMSDFSFLNNKGGHMTDDLRITSMMDYSYMSNEERETVEWYVNDCVGIYVDNKLKMVVNPEGYSYARYFYLPTEESDVLPEFRTDTGITPKEAAENREKANELVAAYNSLAALEEDENLTVDENVDIVKGLIDDSTAGSFDFNVGVVRAIEDDKMKSIMYAVLTKLNSLPWQFKDAHLQENQKITIVRMSDFGGVFVNYGWFKSFEIGKYAQYDEAVKLIFNPRNKNGSYYSWLKNETVLIYDGWHENLEDLLWETLKSDGTATVRRTKCLSCDPEQFEIIMNHLKEKSILPLINTYDPNIRRKI